MKLYLPIIASLFLVSTSYSSLATVIKTDNTKETTVIAQNIDPYIKDNIAREITVKISSDENGGSGVIIGKQNNTYLILTNNHVLRTSKNSSIKNLIVQTHDGATHQATIVENGIATNDDLALLQFNSDKTYQTATINSAATPKVEQTVLAVGYDAATGKLVTQEGKIQQLPTKTFKDGYQIGYSSNIIQGMSGGAIINADGEVIGINGKSAFPIVNTGYTYQDETQPTAAEIEQYRQLSWGLSLNNFLSQVNSEIITAYNLPVPETPSDVGNTQLTGWLGELEAKAKQITVRIDSSSGANGSGIIIAKEGNSYTVVTADHVICEKDEARKCLNNTYEILAPDGKTYPVEASTIKRQEGVDLAVVRFTSTATYQVAQLANYPVTQNDAVFVAGYPKLNKDEPAPWRFSLGYGLNREQGLLDVNNDIVLSDNYNNGKKLGTSSQNSLANGYEMVYTSITYGGMSGGAVLDREGRVIGIHGLAEGETALNSQDSSATKIQLGYSLGIPVNTLIGLADKLAIGTQLPIVQNKLTELNPTETKAFEDAILSIKISQGNTTPERWLERGNQLWRLKRYDEAIQVFDKVIALKPEFVHLAYYNKGLALLYGDKNEAALASFEQATSADPNYALAFLHKSEVLKRLNQFDKALVAIDKAIALQKDNTNLYSQRGLILKNLKQYTAAEAALTTAINLNPRADFYNNRGAVYKEQGKLDLALADYNQSLALNPNHALSYYNRAKFYEEQGKIDLALADYNKAIAFDATYEPSYNNRGIIYYNQEKFDLALADYNKAISLDPAPATTVILYSNRGGLYTNLGKFDLAEADLNRAISLDSNYVEGYVNRGNLYSKQKKLDLALADHNKAIAINGNFADAYYNRGLVYMQQGKLDLALTDLTKTISLDSKYALAYVNRGILYVTQGKIDLALADYNKGISADPKESQAYVGRGRIYDKQGKRDLALADYNKAISLNPQNPLAYDLRGISYYQQEGKKELALADFNKAIALDPNNPQYAGTYFHRGIYYQEEGKTDLAKADFDKAILLDPNLNVIINQYISSFTQRQKSDVAKTKQKQETIIASDDAQTHCDRGNLYSKQDKLDLALAEYNQALAIDPNYIEAYLRRGLLYLGQEKLDLALSDFDKAIEINPNLGMAYYYKSIIYIAQGKTELAEADFNKALLLDPSLAENAQQIISAIQEAKATETEQNQESFSTSTDAQTHYDRGNLYLNEGKNDAAFTEYNQALAINPNFVKAYLNRGIIYYNQGKLDLALAEYNQALAIDPNFALGYYNRGLVYQQQGQRDLAEADYNKALQLDPNLTQASQNLNSL
jgi:tetratricopeptide (TPR) repeat protein/S1-C subfamily serine protease